MRPLEKGVTFHTRSRRGIFSPLRAQGTPEAPAPPAERTARAPSIPGRDTARETKGSSRDRLNT